MASEYSDKMAEEKHADSTGTLRKWLNIATEPVFLFTAIGIVVLAVIWGMTLNLIRVQYAAAEHGAIVSSSELAETYEAQVLRSIREIDQNLNLVKHEFETGNGGKVLPELKEKGLLLPDMLFTVNIVDRDGNIVESSDPLSVGNVADEDYFRDQLQGDVLGVSQPRRHAESGNWSLHFSRRLNAPNGSFAGLVMVSVDAAYFVSGYESSKLGEDGLLGLLGADGVFRVRRSGDMVTAGDRIEYSTLVPDEDTGEISSQVIESSIDDVERYTSARRLFDLPLAVVVGLSVEEQLAAARHNARTYLWRAAGGSLLLIFVMALLGRLSRELALSRQKAVEEQIEHAKQVEYLAFHDGLTGLPNRSLFSKLLAQSINQARRYDRKLAVLFLDLDRFKQINDTLGHDAGDDLLKEVARRLQASLRESDTVARLGGDEFVMLLPELMDEFYSTTVAQKVLSSVAQPFTLVGQEFRVTASVGISTYPQDGVDEQTLTKNADIAMYKAKQDGKNNYQFYSDSLNANSLERLALESGLRRALEKHEFELHYQAKRDIQSGDITGMEALLRWKHPDLGTVAPMEFIPVAEESGLIVPIGKWVLRTACMQNVAWQNQGLPHLSMAVNLTARQFFDEGLITDVKTILRETGMDPHELELEISENLLMGDIAKTLRILTAMKDIGVLIAIDDFGTGYSSLTTLKQFPLNTVKIDRSFIRNLASGAEDHLTEAIIDMGRSLSLTVVAKGVETKEQVDYLREKSCDEFQGFYFNKPLPPDQIAKLFDRQ